MNKNKRMFQTGLLMSSLISLVALPSVLYAAKGEMAVVNVSKIFDEYEKTKEFDHQFQAEGRAKQEERDAIIHEIRRLKDEQSLLSDDQKKKKQEQIDQKLKELDSFDLELKRLIERKRNEAIRDVFKDIEGNIGRFGERKGFQMILNDRAVLYRGAAVDATQEVLNELNDSYHRVKKKV